MQEVALYDTLEAHVVEQTRRGRLMVFEVDGFHLPDTRGVSYRLEHTKTTIAVNRIDPGAAASSTISTTAGLHARSGPTITTRS